MSILNDSSHPLYVSPENRKIAQQRANKYVEMISGYLEASKTIPTGFNSQTQILENKKRILKVLNATEKEWNDYFWQLKNVIRDVNILAKIIKLNDQEIKDIEKTATQYRWSVSPYYSSLMDPEDEACPIRKQAIDLNVARVRTVECIEYLNLIIYCAGKILQRKCNCRSECEINRVHDCLRHVL